MTLKVIPIKSDRMFAGFEIYHQLLKSVFQNQEELKEGDIIVISTKFVSFSQKRILELSKIKISEKAESISKKFQINQQIAEVVIRESDKIFGGINGFLITSSNNIMAPNAGIDKSNAKKGEIILYPENPYLIAEQIKRKIFLEKSIHVGIILVDSRLMPMRVGTVGVAISCAGIEPVLDMRAKKDLDGNPLKVTFQAIADNLASIANLKMGEGNQSKPFAIIRDSEVPMTNREIYSNEMTISPELCVYVRGLGNKYEN